MTTPDRAVAFHDLPIESFPFRVEFINTVTDEVVHTIDVDGPGTLRVPGRDALGGVPVAVRMTFPDGRVEFAGPPGATRDG